MDNELKPGTLCYCLWADPYAHGKVVEVVGPYMGTDVDDSDQFYEVWADWLNDGTYGEPRRGMGRRMLRPINPPGLAESLTASRELDA